MNWKKDCDSALISECRRYMISRADVGRRGLVYSAIRLGKPWPSRDGGPTKGWDGSELLGNRTVYNERAAREAAVAQLQAVCADHAGRPS